MKLLHLSHHEGCKADIDYMAAMLKHEVQFFKYSGGYNISHEKAQKAWDENKELFNSVDRVITSDTAPLSRIILQNIKEFKKKLIIWVCNRFDYRDMATNNCGFPDKEYYDLFNLALKHEQVQIVSYTDFEWIYGRMFHNIDFSGRVIKPIGKQLIKSNKSLIPCEKFGRFFIPSYHNDTKFMNLGEKGKELHIPVYQGKYAGPQDLVEFNGIIHIPYAWSNFALFENWQNGMVYFIPSMKFIYELSKLSIFFWSPPFVPDLLVWSEWYYFKHKDLIVYFDSWEDLQEKVINTNMQEFTRKIKEYIKEHEYEMLKRWEEVLR